MALADDMAGAAAISLNVLAAGGTTPTQSAYASLVAFGKAQFASYQSMGVGNPSLGPFEALGRAFASDSLTKPFFATKYDKATVSDFVDTAYSGVFGTAPASDAKAALTAQHVYFENLYRGVGIPTGEAALLAKGAVLGQIVGYAFADTASAAKSGLDNVVNPIVAKANAGDFSDLGKPLPPYLTGNEGAVVIVQNEVRLTSWPLDPNIKEIFVADPDYMGTSLRDFVAGQDKIDLSMIAFAPNVVLAALPYRAGVGDAAYYLSDGKQYAAVIDADALYVDLNGNGKNDTGDFVIGLVGTEGRPGTGDLIFV
jgi:hypothetical protein